ncbi:MAG: diaminopimelate decarboxylase, partial [Alphaproteobacteria bacterium]
MSTTVFNYNGGKLSTGGIDLQSLAEKYGTPLYVYNNDHIIDNYNSFMNAFDGKCVAHFAMKSNSNQAILTGLAKAGCGMDIVSGGELQRAIKAGVSPDKIIFSGVAKSDSELADALNAGILQINVESVEEIHQLNDVAKELGKVAPVALRVNPNVDAGTHDKISTGKKTDKFGIDIELAPELYKQMNAMDNINPVSISVHIGSQLMSAEPFVESYKKVAELAETLIASGTQLKRLDLGGGLGICYEKSDTPPDVNEYAKMVNDTVGHLNLDLHFEPGRWLVGNAGALIGRVENVKSNDVKTFVLGDVAMNDLVRPT